jgi:hypothetical protein
MSEIVADKKESDIRLASRDTIKAVIIKGSGRSSVGSVGRQSCDLHSPKDNKEQREIHCQRLVIERGAIR